MRSLMVLLALAATACGQVNQYGVPSNAQLYSPTWPIDTYQVTSLEPLSYRHLSIVADAQHAYVFVYNDAFLPANVARDVIQVVPVGISCDLVTPRGYGYLGWLDGSALTWLGPDAWAFQFSSNLGAPVHLWNLFRYRFHFVGLTFRGAPIFFTSPEIDNCT